MLLPVVGARLGANRRLPRLVADGVERTVVRACSMDPRPLRQFCYAYGLASPRFSFCKQMAKFATSVGPVTPHTSGSATTFGHTLHSFRFSGRWIFGRRRLLAAHLVRSDWTKCDRGMLRCCVARH